MKRIRNVSARLPIIAALLIGCGGQRVWVTVRPKFDYEKIKTVAILPFEYAGEERNAGTAVADKLSMLLMSRGIYNIIPPEEVSQAHPPRIVLPNGKVDSDAARTFGRRLGADALLAGNLIRYRADRFHEVRFYGDPFPFSESLHEAYYDEIPVDWFRIDGVVEAEVTVIDASTGGVVWRDRKIGTDSSYGSPPALDEPEVLDRAADGATRKLLLGLVPHEQRVKVSPQSLIVCGGYIDHPLDIRNRFTPADGALYIVIELDRDFAGKSIDLKIEKPDAGSVIAEDRFVWEESSESRAFRKEIGDLIASGGYGRYRVSYSIGKRVIAHHDFHIEQGTMVSLEKGE